MKLNNEDKTTGSTGSSDRRVDTSQHNMNPIGDTITVPMVTHAEAMISGTYPDTAVNGLATFETTTDGKIKMTLNITVAAKANKMVAVHLHEHGDCGDSGKASHGHWNPGNTQHGGTERAQQHGATHRPVDPERRTARVHRGVERGQVLLDVRGDAGERHAVDAFHHLAM